MPSGTFTSGRDTPPKKCPLSNEGLLFRHFFDEVARILNLSFEDDMDPIRQCMLSQSPGDSMLRDAVLCLSASHLMNQRSSQSSDLQDFSILKDKLWKSAKNCLATRARIGSCCKENITPSTKADFGSAFTTHLLLYMYELSEGTSSDLWVKELNETKKFAQSILDDYHHTMENVSDSCDEDSGNQKISYELLTELGIPRPLIQFFLYHDTLGMLANDQDENFICQLHEPLWDSLSMQAQLESSVSPEYGFLDILSRIYKLQKSSTGDNPRSYLVITEAVHIWEEIGTWAVPEPKTGIGFLLEAYIVALSIWVMSILYPDNIAKDKIQTMVLRGISCLASVDDSTLRTASVFPFFLIGLCCIHKEDREIIEEVLNRLETARCLGSIRLCKARIQRSWEDYDSGYHDSWNWTSMTKLEGYSVPLV